MKRLFLGLAVAWLSTAALAQQDQERSASLTLREWEVVGEKLGHHPYREVAPIIDKLRRQLTEPARPGDPIPPSTRNSLPETSPK
jgi:hypothetical protein